VKLTNNRGTGYSIGVLGIFLGLIFLCQACGGGSPKSTSTPVATNTPRPTATLPSTATPAVKLDAEKRIDDQGFAFRPLPNYQIDLSFGVQMLAPGADSDSGPGFILAGGESADGTTTQSLIDTLKSPELEVGESKPVTVDGVAGLAVEIKRPVGDLLGRVVVVMVTPKQQFMIMGFAPKVQWEKDTAQLFDALLNSVKLFEMKPGETVSTLPTDIPNVPVATDAIPPTTEAGPPTGFQWRIGGASSFDENIFSTMQGMDASPDNLVYVADAMRGVWVFDTSGKIISKINDPDMNQPADVQIGKDGNVYVAAWASHAVFVFSPAGKLIRRFGVEGKGNGQFGQFSPSELAVGPDGRIYVYDPNKDSADNNIDRIQIFNSQGKWLKTFTPPDTWAAPDGMDFGPDGKLYTVSFIDREITQYDAEGKLLGTIKSDTLDNFVGAQDMDIDAAGNFYIVMWDYGVIKLDPRGNLLGQWGTSAGEIDQQSWPEGTNHYPSGVAALKDGSAVYFSDSSGYYAYVTAFSFDGSAIVQPGGGKPGSEMRQWASSAVASSQYSDPNWAAKQTTGMPDVSYCGDNTKAWASAGTTTVEWIELSYDLAVIPTQVNIFETYNPDQVIQVDLKDTAGNYHEIYVGNAYVQSICPFTLSIPVKEVNYSAVAVKITIDQSRVKNWAEIDAVELVGIATDGSGYTPSDVTLDAKSGLPVMESATDLYSTDTSLNYYVKTNLATARAFYTTELPKLGWLLDLDEKGKCRDNDRCKGWHGGYDDPKTTTFFFLMGDHAYLTLNFIEENGRINVIIGIDPEYK